MKKIYFLLLTLLMGFNGLAQGTPVITIIGDGDCTGGVPKFLEIYANGTVDFSLYKLQNQTNTNTTWGADFALTDLGIVTDDFVYIYYDSTTDDGAWTSEFPSVDPSKAIESSVINLNGDDRIRIIRSDDGTVIDVYGEDGVDGTGTSWEYTDGYSKRVDGTGPDATFNSANWSFHKGELDGQGTCQGGTAFETIIGIGTYSPDAQVTPSLTIVSPANNAIFNPETTTVSVELSVANFNVAQPSNGDGYIVYEFDNDAPVNKYDTTPIELTGLTPGVHHVSVQLVDNNGAPLNPAVTAEVTFTIKAYNVVVNLSELRAGTLGEYYSVTGEAFVIGGQQTSWGALQGFIVDFSGPNNSQVGMLVYDNNGIITINPNDYDGINNIKGKLSEYKGVLQLLPTTDAVLTGNNHPVDPQVITADELNTNHENYESELIKIVNATIDPAGDTNFVVSKSYDLTDTTATTILRTYFTELEGETIPTTAVDVTGIGGEYLGTAQIYPRDISDIVAATSAVSKNNIKGLNIYPNPVTNGNIRISSDNNAPKQITIFNITGKQVFNGEVENGEAINIRNLNSGVYLIKIIENDKVAVQKLMVK